MKDHSESLIQNVAGWELRTPIHANSEFYDVAAFRAGSCSLKWLERKLCGDVFGRRLLHLQCHFGLDTLSWARLGAKVVGVDFSPSAIRLAQGLAAEISCDARFVVADVLAPDTLLDEKFDIVFTSYGVLCWLNSLDPWAKNIANWLLPGGRLVVVEFHPILDVFFEGCISGVADYFYDQAVKSRALGTYADRESRIDYTQIRWAHTVSEVSQALLDAGLDMEAFAEYPFCSYPIVPALDVEREGMWHCSSHPERWPYMFSMVARKPGKMDESR